MMHHEDMPFPHLCLKFLNQITTMSMTYIIMYSSCSKHFCLCISIFIWFPHYLLCFIGPIMVRSQEENQASVNRAVMRIAKPGLQIRDAQTNTDKDKAAVVEVPKRRRTKPL